MRTASALRTLRTRMTFRKNLAVFTTLSAATLLAGVCSPAASAAPMVVARTQQAAIDQAVHVAGGLGAASGGIHLDHGKAVVNVLDDAAARQVRAAGLTANKVKHSFAHLTGVKRALDGIRDVPQTTWG